MRLVHNGPVAPPDGLAPYFVFTPSSPQDHQIVLFTACNDPQRSCAPANNPIASYSWNFGDGTTGSGVNPSHTYASKGTFTVTLIVSDGTMSSPPATPT